jgi:dihydrofolate reductase
MRPWETAHERPSVSEPELEFARIWKDMPKIVFSKTLERVEGNARLVRDHAAEEVARLKAEPGKDLAVGGAGLAATFVKRDLIDEYRLFVNPVVLGGGTPYFPALDERINLELVETRTFGSRVVYLRYRARGLTTGSIKCRTPTRTRDGRCSERTDSPFHLRRRSRGESRAPRLSCRSTSP